MSSKKKTPPLGQGTHGDLTEILSGMVQLLEWMDQLLRAALKQAAVASGGDCSAQKAPGDRKRAGPGKQPAAKKADRRPK